MERNFSEDDKLTAVQRQTAKVKSIYNYVLGTLIIAVGIAFLLKPGIMKEYLAQYDDAMIQLFAGLCFIYGAFRIYRGYAKNYFH